MQGRLFLLQSIFHFLFTHLSEKRETNRLTSDEVRTTGGHCSRPTASKFLGFKNLPDRGSNQQPPG